METTSTPPTYQTLPTEPQETSPNPMLPRVETPLPAIPAPKPASSKRWLWIVLASAIILAGAAYAWLWLSPATPAATPTPSPTATATADPTAGWKEHTNEGEDLGIAYKLPSSWVERGVDNMAWVVEDKGTTYTTDSAGTYYPDISFLVVLEQPSIEAFENFYFAGAGTPTKALRKPGTVTIGGYPAYVYSGSVAGAGHEFRVVLVNGRAYVIDSNGPLIRAEQGAAAGDVMDRLFEKFLTTVRFDPTAGWTSFSSRFFTLSFKVPPGYSVGDEQNWIGIADGDDPGTSELSGAGHLFMFLERYANGLTKEKAMTDFRQANRDVRVSTITVDSLTFTRMDGTNNASGVRWFAVFFDQSVLRAIENDNPGQSPDYLSIADQILSTFRFTK